MTDWLLIILVVSGLLWFALTNPLLPIDRASELEPAYVDNLKKHVVALSETYSPRMAEFDNLRPSARYIKKQFDQYTKEARYQHYVTRVGRVNNVVASFGPAESKEVIVIGAHYDAHQGMPGADGNASGVSGLIELARILAAYENLPLQVELVAYALGEKPFYGTREMGSFYHANDLKVRHKKVELMISLDGIGYFTRDSDSQSYPYTFMKFFYPARGDFIKVTGRLQDMGLVRQVKRSFSKVDELPVRSLTAPEIFPSIGGVSDDQSYWQHGYPAIRITDTGAARNPRYQTDQDTAKTLDYEAMSRVVQGVGQVIVDMANEMMPDSTMMLAQKMPEVEKVLQK
ncbi:MAG: Peptidase M28 [uncultured Thiotrichaceae bacterium]|uniref:Peptidase M28 n=1 Tax=uncultured Thiotrichaceae bacterium TaxID=298394 RepID=A0A6S6UCC5_9GAMM|nr:MAG: Peptidase M28 [uncultured Thiotrichaceae bacterium]